MSAGSIRDFEGVPFTQVDAFSSTPFSGNPAAVLEFKEFPPDEVLTKIAAENNLSETAFYVHKGGTSYNLRCEAITNIVHTLIEQGRWFTPTVEVNLCGHATMAAAHTIFTNSSSKPAGNTLHMDTKSGMLTVTRNDDESLSMELPEWPQGEKPSMIEAVADAVGQRPVEVHWTEGFRDALAVFDSPKTVLGLKPNLAKLEKLPPGGLICTASGPFEARNCDFVYRFFAPSLGIDEDPACGSAQCALAPYWSSKLSKNVLNSYQLSKRRAEIRSVMVRSSDAKGENRVVVSGGAVTVIKGTMRIG